MTLGKDRRTSGKSAGSAGATHAQVVVTAALMLALVALAHLVIDVTFPIGGRFGDVVELNPLDPRSYGGEHLNANPTLLVVGNSQQFLLPGKERNESPRIRAGGDMILDEVARLAGSRYPNHRPGTFVRFATTWFMPIEMLGTLGLWLERAPPSETTIIIAANVFDHDETQTIRPKVTSLLAAYPESTRALLERLAQVQDGPMAAERLRSALEKSRTESLLPRSADDADVAVRRWLERHEAWEGSAFVKGRLTMRYQKLEAPFLQAFFGRVDQPGRSIDAAALLTGGPHRFLQVLVRTLRLHKLRPICYAMPWNPHALRPSAKTDELVDKMGRDLAEAGCAFIDASRAVPDAQENWGWWGGQPDFDHLTPEGIRTLATFLLERIAENEPSFTRAGRTSR